MSFQGMGISGTGERFATKDDKALTVTDLPGMGPFAKGRTARSAGAGSHQRPARAQRRRGRASAPRAVWNPELRMNELYKSIELKPDPSGAGLECLLLTPTTPRP